MLEVGECIDDEGEGSPGDGGGGSQVNRVLEWINVGGEIERFSTPGRCDLPRKRLGMAISLSLSQTGAFPTGDEDPGCVGGWLEVAFCRAKWTGSQMRDRKAF